MDEATSFSRDQGCNEGLAGEELDKENILCWLWSGRIKDVQDTIWLGQKWDVFGVDMGMVWKNQAEFRASSVVSVDELNIVWLYLETVLADNVCIWVTIFL